jgi:Trk K+ transport system NAD-binding subunit
MVLMGGFRYKKKVGFLAGASLSQISEFSLILALLGLKVGHIDETVFALITLTGIISIGFSAYIINYAERIYLRFSSILNIFERRGAFEEIETLGGYDVILFGCHRVGYDFIEVFKKLHTRFLGVDYDPEIISDLLSKGINIKYGDADDGEFLEDIKVYEAKAVISTIPDYDTNLFILSKTKHINPEIITILTSYRIEPAIELYERGADYVIVPHFIGGQIVSRLAKDAVFGVSDLSKTRENHIQYLKHRKYLGHSSSF